MIYNWKKIVRYGLPLLTLTVIIELFVGQLLQYGRGILLQQLTIFFISIPVINSVGGNIGCILGARLASGLHVGSIQIDIHDKKMHEQLITAVLMGFITYFVLAIGIYSTGLFGSAAMKITFLPFLFVILATGAVLVCAVSLISVITAFISFKKGIDPDDVVAPIVTTMGDTLGILILFMFIGVVMI